VGVLAFSVAASTIFPVGYVAPAFVVGLILAVGVTVAPGLRRRYAHWRTRYLGRA